MKRAARLAGIVLAAASPALAWTQVERLDFASDLGMILASETVCGLSLDRDAVAALIERTVPSEDTGFASMLATMTTGFERDVGDTADADRPALCARVIASARSYGLVG